MTKKKSAGNKKRRLAAKVSPAVERSPEYMIQVSDPKMLRKDILESLREVIIFMQGYEKFRKIQEEKVALFSSLKIKVRELNSLIDNKLRNYLPKGNLKPVVEEEKPLLESEEPEEEEISEAVSNFKKAPKVIAEEAEEEPRPRNDLAELESQLEDIERELKKIS